MICAKDSIFHILYCQNHELLDTMLSNMLCKFKTNWKMKHLSYDIKTVLFLTLMDKDIETKKRILIGYPKQGIDAMNPNKAELFFMSISEEIIQPWLSNESISNEKFLEKTRALYWSC